ncbi:hypothetical protein TSUD_155310 [Trifolium subterraneum]|uniref:Replication protein A 70 kDa DNA-binding subunit B/D first OB fold domain-containing protein n=1 Tax=Trifolium subterraneum TaxID=3900 RepID=A0A2Z6NGH0_TRISU|nr:hypothetical protein TSUD_155310 [Trifolium subterraneum]
MSRPFDFIKDLNKERDIWKIAVRVIDSWTVVGTNGHPHLEMVIADEKGDRVKAVTRFKEYEHWKSYIVDQKIYVLYNCHVYDNDSGFKVCDGPFKVVFGTGTRFQVDDGITNIPPHEFRFKSFKEVLGGKFKINVLYEIIGVIHEVVKNQNYANGKKPCTNLILANESGEMVDVALWEAFSTQLMTYISDRKEKGPIVLILTHAQCKLGDNGRPSFSNNWTGSKLLINDKHPVVAKFKSSYKDIEKSQAATKDFTQISSSSQVTNNDDFSNMSQVKSIAQMKDTQKVVIIDNIMTHTALLLELLKNSILINMVGIMRVAPNALNPQGPTQSADEVSKHPSISEKEKDECSESLNFPSQSLSACGDNDFEAVSNKTPAKRPSPAATVDDIASPSIGTTKQSSTKTKPTKHVKLE